MRTVQRPALPMPTPADIHELSMFLAANVSVAKADGDPAKAARYQAMLDTTTALAERAVDLSEVTRVVVVHSDPKELFAIDIVKNQLAGGRTYDKSQLYTDGCVIDVQNDGRTLKLLPTPKLGAGLWRPI